MPTIRLSESQARKLTRLPKAARAARPAASTSPAPATPARRAPSALEGQLALQLRLAGLPKPEREYRFDPTRKWRADFAWPALKLLVEVEGGTWMQGRHARGAGMRADAQKYNHAVLENWRLLRVTPDMIRDGTALQTIERALLQ